jgi:hypothetical protein
MSQPSNCSAAAFKAAALKRSVVVLRAAVRAGLIRISYFHILIPSFFGLAHGFAYDKLAKDWNIRACLDIEKHRLVGVVVVETRGVFIERRERAGWEEIVWQGVTISRTGRAHCGRSVRDVGRRMPEESNWKEVWSGGGDLKFRLPTPTRSLYLNRMWLTNPNNPCIVL